MIVKDLLGRRFGRLLVTTRACNDKRGKARWFCVCDCGKITIVSSTCLLKGDTKSCGCLKKELSSGRLKMNKTTHGKADKERLYHIWKGMKQRCSDHNRENYQYYGGRGITVCDEWLDNFERFRDWALSHGYSDDLSIDRIDVDGNYEPTNCRWATVQEQANNKRNNTRRNNHE